MEAREKHLLVDEIKGGEMCGIIGYMGKKKATPILVDGLKRLEYRGYDSAGIAVLDKKIEVIKDVGKVEEIFGKLDLEKLLGGKGIAHTRWATHGKVTKENAHPQLSNNGEIAVVHNGIIENYQELRNFLQEKGFSFKSETDTEVIPNLVELSLGEGLNFRQACERALEKLEGSYAIIALHENGELIAARKGSPLVIGIGDGEYFIASDIPAFLDYTKKVVYLQDCDFVEVTSAGINFFNLKHGRVERPVHAIEWNAEQAEKGEFNHFMLKEICEQVETIQRAAQQDETIINQVVQEFNRCKGIFLVGCGSSYHACLAASYIFSKIAGIHVNTVLGSEFPNYEHFLTKESLVVAVSQSGETADVLEAVKTAKNKGSKVISIVNVMGSSLTRYSDQFLLMHSGPEICVLSTKTYTSQLVLLTLLAYAIARKYEEGKQKLRYLWNVVYNLTAASTRENVKKLAETLKDKEHLFTVGRGRQYATALEAALKIKEVSYIHAEGLAAGELKHGVIALIEEGTPCIVFSSEENERETISNAMEIKSRGGVIIGVASKNNELYDFFIKVPEAGVLDSICQIIPAQILAYQLAVLRGLDPDKPRNLAKSVTVK